MNELVDEAYGNGFEDGYKQADIDKRRYRERYRIATSIMDAMNESEEINSCETEKLFKAWCEDEEGDLAVDRLVNLIIY